MNNLNINSYKFALDNNDIDKIEKLIKSNNENNEIDIIFEMYTQHLLTPERLHFIFENCSKYFNLFSNLIKKLLKEDKDTLLDIIFKI